MNEYKDTLKLYDDLIKSGVSEPAARAQAQQLGVMGNVVDLLRYELNDFKVSITKDLFWMRVIGGTMVAALLSNGIFNWVTK